MPTNNQSSLDLTIALLELAVDGAGAREYPYYLNWEMKHSLEMIRKSKSKVVAYASKTNTKLNTEINGDKKFRGTIQSTPQAPALARVNSTEIKPNDRELLGFLASRIVQPRPRRVLRFCVLFSCTDLVLATVCFAGLAVFMYRSWWVFVIGWILAVPPVVFSFLSCIKGQFGYIAGISMSSLCNVCAAIAVMCTVMTYTALSMRIYHQCGPGVSHVGVDGELDCSQYSESQTAYFSYIAAHRACITGLSVVCGASSVVLSGVSMAYAFFLARRVKRHPANWLVSAGFSTSRLKLPKPIAVSVSTQRSISLTISSGTTMV